VSDIYTGFSNYSEINVENRKTAVENEVHQWAEKKSLYTQYREEWSRAANEEYLPDHPLHIDIELSDACNLKCEMCAHGIGTVENVGFMDENMVFGLIDEAISINTYSIKLNWRGESLLNPILPMAVKYAKDKGILEISINTNGLPKNGSVLIETAESGIDRFIFSVDGYSKEVYESIRVKGDYNKLMDNIMALIKWKKDTNSVKPFLRVQMVRSKKNAHQVDDFIKFWQDKVDDVRISDVMDRGQGEVLSVGDQVTVGRRRCPQPFQRLVVGRDGRVSPCCADWEQKYIVGDITKRETLIDIWKGKKIQFMRDIQNHAELKKIDICKNCYVKESYIWMSKDERD